MSTGSIESRGRRNEVIGQVISDKMEKTCKVKIYRVVKHPKYKKYVRRTSVFTAHNGDNKAKTGDTVRIVETRALSKTKRWKVAEIIEAAKVGVAR
jgi:small subunit ribosomal protein S17